MSKSVVRSGIAPAAGAGDVDVLVLPLDSVQPITPRDDVDLLVPPPDGLDPIAPKDDVDLLVLPLDSLELITAVPPPGADVPGAPWVPSTNRVPPFDAQTLAGRWELVLPHHQELLRIARRRVDNHEDAEDVVATALVRTVEHPGLDETRVGPFLCTMVMRLAVDTHRHRARQLTAAKRVANLELAPAPLGEAFCDAAESRWLRERLRDIPQRERQVLKARMSGLTSQQTSVHLGLSLKATDNAYARMRVRARKVLLTAARADGEVL